MKNIWKVIKTILLWAIGIFGMIYAVAVFLESTQVITKIFTILLFLVSGYILPSVSKMLNFNIKPLITGAIFLVGFIGSIATVYNGTEAENLVKKEKEETSKTILYSTTDNLNVRKDGSINDKILFQINKGDKLVLLEKGAEWSEIECEKGKGFVSTKYISKDYPKDDNVDNWWLLIFLILGVVVLSTRSGRRFAIRAIARDSSLTSREKSEQYRFIRSIEKLSSRKK